RAVRQLAERAGNADLPGLHIHLDKRLPHGAGLGGGSSDAAECLRFARTLVSRPLSDADVLETAAAVGSDVPFFLGQPVALGTGRGEVLSPMALPPMLMGRWLAVVVPSFGISTAQAYAGIAPRDQDRPDLTVLLASADPADWRAGLVNDFETHLFAAHPALDALKKGFYDAGAVYSAMSGSGSAVFALFDTEVQAREAARALAPGIRASWVGPAEPAG
ncbi:MAG: 4-(cytidine 5'-diphospho)-2-C-methyl-D-erythritol kinase, partial [Bacteroidetes bacterium]|nr:4-(cytidine 5'-diphospho)-2-C-methyl-D-erythritol kinase [Bacteroidota bacterium]